jgi:hypothetical protein
MIAAVVKGTTFTVTVGANYAEVHVAEGLVEVKTPDGIGHSMVPSGVTAFVSKAEPSKIEIQSPSATGARPAGQAALPAAAGGQTETISGDLDPGKPDLDSLTNGLLQSSQHSNGNASAQGVLRAQTGMDVASANAKAAPFASVHSQLGASVNGNGNVNAGGANANGNAYGNSGGSNGNANAGGANGSGNANANAGGVNGNGNGNANAGGANGNGNGNANAGGANSNGNANANAGGANGNGNANANGKAGG